MGSYLVHCYRTDGQCEPIFRLCTNRLDALKIAREFMYSNCDDRTRIRITRSGDGMQVDLEDEIGPYRAHVKWSD